MSKSRQKSRQKTRTVAKLFEGRLRLELRNRNPNYYARTFIQVKLVGKSTGETTLGAAKQVAGEWYRGLLGRVSAGESLHGRTFDQLVEPFFKQQDSVQEVSPLQRRNYRHKWSVLEPFLTGVRLTDIDLPWLEQLRDKRLAASVKEKAPLTPTTIKKDLLFIRKVLGYAVERERCLDTLPVFPTFTGRKWKTLPNPRPFFTHA